MSTDFYHFILPQILCDDWRKCKRKAALNDSLHILFFFLEFSVFTCLLCSNVRYVHIFCFLCLFYFLIPVWKVFPPSVGKLSWSFCIRALCPSSTSFCPPLLTLAITCCLYLYSVVLQLTYTKYKAGIVWRIALSICNLWDRWKCTYAWK